MFNKDWLLNFNLLDGATVANTQEPSEGDLARVLKANSELHSKIAELEWKEKMLGEQIAGLESTLTELTQRNQELVKALQFVMLNFLDKPIPNMDGVFTTGRIEARKALEASGASVPVPDITASLKACAEALSMDREK